jgi:hypothetical protein
MRIRPAIMTGTAGLATIALAIGAICLVTQARWARGPLADADRGLQGLQQRADLEIAVRRTTDAGEAYFRTLDAAQIQVAGAGLTDMTGALETLDRTGIAAAADSMHQAALRYGAVLDGARDAAAEMVTAGHEAHRAAVSMRAKLRVLLAAQAQHQKTENSRDGLDFFTRTTTAERIFVATQADRWMLELELARRDLDVSRDLTALKPVRAHHGRIRDLLAPWAAKGDPESRRLASALDDVDAHAAALAVLEQAWVQILDLEGDGRTAAAALRVTAADLAAASRREAADRTAEAAAACASPSWAWCWPWPAPSSWCTGAIGAWAGRWHTSSAGWWAWPAVSASRPARCWIAWSCWRARVTTAADPGVRPRGTPRRGPRTPPPATRPPAACPPPPTRWPPAAPRPASGWSSWAPPWWACRKPPSRPTSCCRRSGPSPRRPTCWP